MKATRSLMLLCLIEALLLAPSTVVQAQFTFATNNGSITITGYTGTNVNVVIPDSTNGYPVTSIGNGAFQEGEYGPWNLTSVTIPDSVTNIGSWAFAACFNLTNAIIGNNVVNIGQAAFSGCTFTTINLDTNLTTIGNGAFNSSSLTTITIPANLTNIGMTPFSLCDNLTNISVDTANLNFSSLDGVLFNKDQTILFEYPAGMAGVYVIPNGVSDIGSYAFVECLGLTRIYFPGSVTNIEEGAFLLCESLTAELFEGSPPTWSPSAWEDDSLWFFYVPGTSGWLEIASVFRTGYWFPYPMIPANVLNFGVQNNQFGFTIVWATNVPVIVDACTNLANPQWQPLETNIITDSAAYFTDPQWTNYPSRFYRLRSP